MHPKRSGFTLIELLVVVLILGVLASVAAPSYMKTVETARATDSVGLAQMISNAQRMCMLDHLSDYAAFCPGGQVSARNDASRLISNKYLSGSGFDSSYYNYFSCANTSCGGGIGYAYSIRTNGPYAGWGYYIDASGLCHELGGAPKCPNL